MKLVQLLIFTIILFACSVSALENESIAGKPITMDGKPAKQLRDAMPLTRDVIDFGK